MQTTPSSRLPAPRKGRLRSGGLTAAARRGAGGRPPGSWSTSMALASLCVPPPSFPLGGGSLHTTRGLCPGKYLGLPAAGRPPRGQAQNSARDLRVLLEACCSGGRRGGPWDCGRTRMRGSGMGEPRRGLCRRGAVCGLVLSGSRRGQAVHAGVQVQVAVRREPRPGEARTEPRACAGGSRRGRPSETRVETGPLGPAHAGPGARAPWSGAQSKDVHGEGER